MLSEIGCFNKRTKMLCLNCHSNPEIAKILLRIPDKSYRIKIENDTRLCYMKTVHLTLGPKRYALTAT